VNIHATDQPVINNFSRYTLGRKWEYNGTIQQLLIVFNKYSYSGSFGTDVLYNILNVFGIAMNLIRVSKVKVKLSL
jgi:hypothetical protein